MNSGLAISSAEDVSPWEAEDAARWRSLSGTRQELAESMSPSRIVLRTVLDFYQERQSGKSVHRCAFHTSCSDFLPAAIDAYGFPIGLFAFIDRYLYRENKSAFLNYSLRKRKDGVYKLDDDLFLVP